jgi:uncharacterized protein
METRGVAFQWDERKNEANIRKHGVSFVVVEPFDWDSATYQDDLHHEGEDRHVAYGYASDGKAYGIAYTIRNENFRIISVRRLSKGERAKHLHPRL